MSDPVVSPAGTPGWDFDYERLLDLMERIGRCARMVDLSKRTVEGNRVARALAAQIRDDAGEVHAILAIRQAAIEGASDAR